MSCAVARRYAEALHQLSVEGGVLDEVTHGLDQVRGLLAGDANLSGQFLRSRAAEDEKSRMVREWIGAGVHRLVSNLLHLLVERRREAITLDCILAFFQILEEEQGVLRVVLETAKPMDDEAKDRLVGRLAEATGQQIIAELRVDESLIGGVRLIVDSRLIDGSVRRKIERLGECMMSAI